VIAPHSLPDIGGDPRRLIRLDAVHNFRDMGGYPAAGGRSTRWGRLFRADGLFRLTGDDLEKVRDLGLRTVVDLRTFGELEERGTFPRDEHPVDFHHVPIIDSTWSASDHPGSDDAASEDPADFLESAYLFMLGDGPDRFANAFTKLCEPEALPAVFHCAAGKDRTGLLAMLLLGSMGVPDEYIVADYALTNEGMERMIEWARREQPEGYARISARPSGFLSAAPEAMLRIVGMLRRQFGTIREYVLELGVPVEALARLEAAFLE
jgi:protein-tyrosine phosphatase